MSARKTLLRQRILVALKASELSNNDSRLTGGDIWIQLVFASEAALVKICQQLHIKTD